MWDWRIHAQKDGKWNIDRALKICPVFLHPQGKHHPLAVQPNLEGCASSFSKQSEMAICYLLACGWVSSLHFSRPGLIWALHCSVGEVRTPWQSCPGFPCFVVQCQFVCPKHTTPKSTYLASPACILLHPHFLCRASLPVSQRDLWFSLLWKLQLLFERPDGTANSPLEWNHFPLLTSGNVDSVFII